MSKRIAVVSNTAWSLYNFRLNLMKELQLKGYDVVAVAPFDEYKEKITFEYFDIKMNNQGTNIIEDFFLFWRFVRLYKKIKPDVILQFTIKPNIYGTIAANFLNIPCINNIAGLGTLFIRENWLSKIVKLLYKFSQQFAKKIFFQNRDDAELFSKIIKQDKCDILPGSGVNLEKFSPRKKETSEFSFLLMARLLWDKGVGEYIEATREVQKKYPDIKFKIIGWLDVDNPSAVSKTQMNKWINEGVVEYLGAKDDVRDYIANSDCVVLPSYYREGVPKSLLESASMARPIITTDSIGCREVVDINVNGFLCKPRSVDDLVDKMKKMILLSSLEREEMGKNGRKKMINE
ncbi:MAG: glycosyltransferase family 4 protein, partial [Candidatus Cloacimonetes bacterium]|nr:glycosyltransferase family 4 protein [Candidatus Cloacimonadota bacterium]